MMRSRLTTAALWFLFITLLAYTLTMIVGIEWTNEDCTITMVLHRGGIRIDTKATKIWPEEEPGVYLLGPAMSGPMLLPQYSEAVFIGTEPTSAVLTGNTTGNCPECGTEI